MKTNFKMLMLPVAAFILASAGAVGTNVARTTATKLPPITAFIHDPVESSCKAVTVNCNNVSGLTCTYSLSGTTWTAFRKATPTATACALPLYMDRVQP